MEKAIKKEVSLFLDRTKLSERANYSLSVSDEINSTCRAIERLRKSWIVLYDKYADGELDRETFLNEKKMYDSDIERMEKELADLIRIRKEEADKREISAWKTDQAMTFLDGEEPTEEMKEKLIEKVMVSPGNRIEIVWKLY